ncbi:hypothetical protein DSO57_1033113 [Entomophthora muscae]|uniref:Uncharacterized protein n=1 Tax=Entomophthora muscae TaxID=34485 RepID=A0ACC2SPF6_9FUNG|nr:hypothetical protein DSO57_1033113 [Entomophthora muscae]
MSSDSLVLASGQTDFLGCQINNFLPPQCLLDLNLDLIPAGYLWTEGHLPVPPERPAASEAKNDGVQMASAKPVSTEENQRA